MGEKDFIQKRDSLVREITSNYMYDTWISLTGDRSLGNRPERIKRLHGFVGRLYDVLPQTSEGRAVALRELELLLYSLKYEYEQFAKR